jgi:phosphate acetyltransferase
MDLISHIITKARGCKKTIVLPEGEEERVVKAAGKIIADKIAKIVLLGDEDKIAKIADESKVFLKGISIVNPAESHDLKDYSEEFFNMRKSKGLSKEAADKTMLNPLYFGCMMVRRGQVDGLVGGSVNTTADTVRAALQVVGLKEGKGTLSSFFLMIVPDCEYGEKGAFIFADCGVIPDPSSRQLAAVAVSSAESAKLFFNSEPVVAMLSFSTKGSASHPMIDEVREALDIVRKNNPQLLIDGEFQVDAAIVPSVAKIKVPDNKIAGKANVLIFPDLNSGNIAYKLTQRLAKAEAYGPILQGLAKPVNDLSRGCSVEDIVNVTAITAMQC